jgi:hypothetical protein
VQLGPTSRWQRTSGQRRPIPARQSRPAASRLLDYFDRHNLHNTATTSLTFHSDLRLSSLILEGCLQPTTLPHRGSDRHIPRPLAYSSLSSPQKFQSKSLRMRNALATLVLFPAIALAAPDFVTDFEPAVLQEAPAQNNKTLLEDGTLELLKRQGTSCANGWSACTNINQPGICCRNDQICSADAAGHAACCPRGAACTGTIIPIGQATSSISVTQTTATTTGVFVTPAPTSTGNPFQQNPSSGGSYIRSTVSNQFFPFPFIPTTYDNAAACSSAYTSCQSDAASCTAALANGAQGVTISAPNGGITQTAVPSVGTQSASSICSSLSQAACSGLQVAACQAFGTGGGTGAAPTRCANVYKVGAGIALGVAGQMLR